MYYVPRGGNRGGQDQFKWEDVKTDKGRECYLGHSVMAPVGRWQKNKDLQWYSKERRNNSLEGVNSELQAVKNAEKEAMLIALGEKVGTQLAKETIFQSNVGPSNLTLHDSSTRDKTKRKHKEKSRKRKKSKREKTDIHDAKSHKRRKTDKRTKKKKKHHSSSSDSSESEDSQSSDSESSEESGNESQRKQKKYHNQRAFNKHKGLQEHSHRSKNETKKVKQRTDEERTPTKKPERYFDKHKSKKHSHSYGEKKNSRC